VKVQEIETGGSKGLNYRFYPPAFFSNKKNIIVLRRPGFEHLLLFRKQNTTPYWCNFLMPIIANGKL